MTYGFVFKSTRSVPFDCVWKQFIDELHLHPTGEPHWFYDDFSSLIGSWLNGILNVDQRSTLSIRVGHCLSFNTSRLFFYRRC
jgi:hypothetical protein